MTATKKEIELNIECVEFVEKDRGLAANYEELVVVEEFQDRFFKANLTRFVGGVGRVAKNVCERGNN